MEIKPVRIVADQEFPRTGFLATAGRANISAGFPIRKWSVGSQRIREENLEAKRGFKARSDNIANRRNEANPRPPRQKRALSRNSPS